MSRHEIPGQPEFSDQITADGQIAKITDRSNRSYRRRFGFLGVGLAIGAAIGLGTPALVAGKTPDEALIVLAGTVLPTEGVVAAVAIGERARARRRYAEIVGEFTTAHTQELERAEAEIPANNINTKVRIPLRYRISPAAPSALGSQSAMLLTLATDERIRAVAISAGLVELGISVATLAVDRRFDRNPRDAYINQIQSLELLRQQNSPPAPEK